MSFQPGIAVFSKNGTPLGSIVDYTVADPPTYLLNEAGSMSFYVPRRSEDQKFLALDRIIMFGNRLGMEPWAGQIDDIEYGGGVAQVSVSGILDQFATADIDLDEELIDDFLAANVYARLVKVVNLQKGRDGELEWLLGSQGTIAKKYYGDLSLQTDGLSALREVAARSDTEFRSRAYIDPYSFRLKAVLLISDRFDSATGPDLKDGIGANVIAHPRWAQESRPIRNSIRLSGERTRISDYVPEWAQWAVHEFEPEVSSSVLPGDRRRRIDREATVEWGLSKREQRRLAAATMNTLWSLYGSFLRAIHDMDGRPWHPGWEFGGPPENYPMLHTGRGWRNHLQLVEIGSTPGSMVMRSRSERQIATVTFSRITGIQTFRRHWYQEGAGSTQLKRMHINGRQWVYNVEAGVIVSRTLTTFVNSRADITPYWTNYIWPTADKDKGEPSQVTLARVVSLSEDGAVTEGKYFPSTMPLYSTLSGQPYQFYSYVYEPHDVNQTSAFIGKMYDFERQRVGEWHPGRDGIGQQLNVATVWKEQPVTRYRWHLVPWRPGIGGASKLIYGATSTQTTLKVSSTFDLPSAPFDAGLGANNYYEIVRVTQVVGGGEVRVQRGLRGTAAIAHEAGEPLQAINISDFDGFKYTYSWPEGSAWLAKILARDSQPRVRLTVQVANVGDLWKLTGFGKRHRLLLETEGPYGGTNMFVRVIGFSPDAANGRMELLLEKTT